MALQFVEDVSQDEGINALHPEVERTKISAQDVYRKAGFKDHHRYLFAKGL